MITLKDFLNEASQVNFDAIGKNNQKTVKDIEKLLNVKSGTYFDGIHGVIVMFDGKHGSVRIDSKDLKKLSSMPLRWVEGQDGGINVGLPYKK